MSTNGNGQAHAATPLLESTDGAIWCVYHDEEREALAEAGLNCLLANRLIEPANRDVILLHSGSDLYAAEKAQTDAQFYYRNGALSVRIAVVPLMRTASLARALKANVVTLEFLEAVALNSPAVEAIPEKPLPAYDEKGRINWARLTDLEMGMRLASTVKPKRIEWLMPDRIPNLAYTLIAGEGKQGKSQFTMGLGALFSTGGEWWDGSGRAKMMPSELSGRDWRHWVPTWT
jgi:AAA domain